MEFLKKLLVQYHKSKWKYYKDMEIAKEAYISRMEADHRERMSELSHREPYDADLAKAEICRWDAFWKVEFNEKCKIGDKKMRQLDLWSKWLAK